MDPTAWAHEAQRILFQYAVPVGGKIVGAVVLWIIGRMIIGAVQRLAERTLEHKKIDVTLARYARSMIGVTLTLLLLLATLSIFGVETTSFAGILAACGVAFGMAWSGLLSNFAAGVFLMVLRPYKVGDMIHAAGITGDVREIGLFATTLDTGDNVRIFVGNAKIFSDNIQNFSVNDYRRVDLKAQLAHGVDVYDAITKLKERVAKIPNIVKDPAPSVELLEFTPMGPVLAVRPFCHNDHYWGVYFGTNEAIVDVCSKAAYPVPETHFHVRKAS